MLESHGIRQCKAKVSAYALSRGEGAHSQDEWRAAADVLGTHVRPILDFLRAQEERQ